MSKQLFFIAILPPLEIQDTVTAIKEHFAQVYDSKAALKSPPHITLQPPFNWEPANLDQLQETLEEFSTAQTIFPVTLNGFAAFPPRVIYVDVERTQPLQAIQKELMQTLESKLNISHKAAKNRPFAPHMTVGFKDLSKTNFAKAWAEFADKKFQTNFVALELTLLQFDQTVAKKWQIVATYPLKK